MIFILIYWNSLKNALNLLFEQINNTREFYDRHSVHWDHSPKTFSDGTTATFPHSCKEYRGLIISLKPQYQQVMAEILRMEQEAEEASTPSSSEGSKAGWFKALLLVGLGVLAAHIPSCFRNSNTQRHSDEDNDKKPHVENRQTAVTNQVENIVTNQVVSNNVSVKQGNVFAAPAPDKPVSPSKTNAVAKTKAKVPPSSPTNVVTKTKTKIPPSSATNVVSRTVIVPQTRVVVISPGVFTVSPLGVHHPSSPPPVFYPPPPGHRPPGPHHSSPPPGFYPPPPRHWPSGPHHPHPIHHRGPGR